MQHSAATARGLRCNFYTKSKVNRFDHSGGSNDLRNLANYLQKLDENTSLRQIQDPAEIQLNTDGKLLRDGYTFTMYAFRQAAQILGPGLSKFLPDLSGMVGTTDEMRYLLVDGRLAINTWNELVDLRFPLFERYRIIRNDRDRTIEGFVSNNHQYLENLWLYHEAIEALTGREGRAAVYAASLTGRRFSLWFRHVDPLFSITVDDQQWPFYGGYYFTNGEATGTSVRGTLAIFTPKGSCLGAYRKFGRRVTHVGRDFMKRLGDMFTAVIDGEIPRDKLEIGAKALLSKSLGFLPGWSAEQRKERKKKISHALSILGIQTNLAVDVTDLALSVGRYHGMPTMEWSQTEQLYSSRTTLDLFVPLLGLARKMDTARREKLEQAAFDILLGRLLL